MERAEAIPNFEIIDPVGYMEMVALMQRAKLILTDSGGVSKESSYAGAKCLFMMDLDVWEDLVRDRWILKVDPQDQDRVGEALQFAKQAHHIPQEERPKYYGDGHAAAKMVQALQDRKLI